MGKNGFTLRLKRKLYPLKTHSSSVTPRGTSVLCKPPPMMSSLLVRSFPGFTWVSYRDGIYFTSGPDPAITYGDLVDPPSPFFTAHIPHVPHFYLNFLDRYLEGEVPPILMAKLWDNPTILYDSSALDKFVVLTGKQTGIGNMEANWPMYSHWSHANEAPMDSCIATKSSFCTYEVTCKCSINVVPSVIAMLNCPSQAKQ